MNNSLFLVKIGGSIAENKQSLNEIAGSLCEMASEGHKLVLVHGGGKCISRNLTLLDEKAEFIDGLRVTTSKTMDMVEMTLSGHVNKKLTGLINREGKPGGIKAIGISGVDASLFTCEPVSKALGQVGHIVKVDTSSIKVLLENGFLPVVSPISADAACVHYNVNADEAARALASALKVDKLVFLSDVQGVLDKSGGRIAELTPSAIEKLVSKGVVTGGMIPKLNSCSSVLDTGVGAVHICGWSGKADFVNQLMADKNEGTVIHL